MVRAAGKSWSSVGGDVNGGNLSAGNKRDAVA